MYLRAYKNIKYLNCIEIKNNLEMFGHVYCNVDYISNDIKMFKLS